MSMALDGLLPRARRLDPTTSVDAGRAANLCESQKDVFEFMVKVPRNPGQGWTHGELEREMDAYGFTYSPSRIRSAVSELEARGLVEWTGETRPTRYGRQARVYRAVSP
jgi:hypothetical protein